MSFRAGFVTFVGRPNVGKSTLTNALVGQKVAITSSKPQTTRRLIRGIVHRASGQIVLVDTPGLHRPRTLLGERLNDLVEGTLSEVDVICMCFPSDEQIGPGDQYINEYIGSYKKAKLVAVVTKAELVTRQDLAAKLLEVNALRDWQDVIPVSAVSGEQLNELAELLISHLPESEELYPKESVTDETIQDRICELIREAALEGVREELPHSLAVTVDEMGQREDSEIVDIHANLWVERDSQKSIIIGKQGTHIKNVGMQARLAIEALLGAKVYLNLHVKVAKEWQRDPKQLDKLGF